MEASPLPDIDSNWNCFQRAAHLAAGETLTQAVEVGSASGTELAEVIQVRNAHMQALM